MDVAEHVVCAVGEGGGREGVGRLGQMQRAHYVDTKAKRVRVCKLNREEGSRVQGGRASGCGGLVCVEDWGNYSTQEQVSGGVWTQNTP